MLTNRCYAAYVHAARTVIAKYDLVFIVFPATLSVCVDSKENTEQDEEMPVISAILLDKQ